MSRRLNFTLRFSAVFVSLIFFACDKSEEIHTSATVLSKHQVPMPFLTCTVNYSRGGKNQIDGSFTIATNADGNFRFDQKSRKYLNYSNIPHYESLLINAKDSGSSFGSFPNGENIIIQLH